MRTLALAALLLARCGAAPPHFITILADDLGWGEPGAFPSTSPHGRIATPHLNQFASHGVRFTDGYAGYTVCAPSRTTLMTGFHSGFDRFIFFLLALFLSLVRYRATRLCSWPRAYAML